MRPPRPVVVACAAVLAAGCGADERSEQGPEQPQAKQRTPTPRRLGPRYGIAVALPAGWHGHLGRGALHAATFPLPRERLPCWAEMACQELAEDGLRVLLLENGIENRSPPTDLSEFPEVTGPLRLDRGDFGPSDGNSDDSLRTGHGFARRTFQLAGRLFVVFAEAGSHPPSADMLAGLNELLASLEVAAGDFYPGTVEPARFPDVAGWHVGTSGRDESDTDGEFTTSWASTIPYADDWNALPPFETLERLPRDGILIWVGLSRSNRFRPQPEGSESFPAQEPPFRLEDFERRRSWKGQVGDLPEYVLWGTVRGEYQVDLRVYFGRFDPSDEMVSEAERMLGELDLPHWGPWETQ